MLRTLLIDNHSKSLEKLVSMLNRFDINPKIIDYEDYTYEERPFDLYLLSGGNDHIAVHSETYYYEQLKLLRNTDKPIIGVCLGFQIVCFAFNTKLEKLDSPRNGVVTIEPTESNIFGNLLPLEAEERHKWGVRTLSNELIGLAKSEDGWEIVKHKEKPIYGIQFHPEIISEGTKGHLLFYKILKDISK